MSSARALLRRHPSQFAIVGASIVVWDGRLGRAHAASNSSAKMRSLVTEIDGIKANLQAATDGLKAAICHVESGIIANSREAAIRGIDGD